MNAAAHPASAAALRAARSAAARALVAHPRRGQAQWDELAAWPTWGDAEGEAFAALALRAGACWYGAAWRRCISGPLVRALHAAFDGELPERLLQAPEPPGGPPPADADALRAHGVEVLLAAVASPLLGLVLRERLAPATLPPLPALDAASARAAAALALECRR